MSNITENRVNTTLLPADITTINTSINAILGKIPSGSLTEEQRSSLLSMDVDNKIFAEDCINEIAISGAGIMPPFISATNIQNDITLYEQCDAIESSLLNVVQRIKDIKRICADETMTTCNAIYKIYEMANLAGMPGAKQAYDKLKVRYAKQSTAAAEPSV